MKYPLKMEDLVPLLELEEKVTLIFRGERLYEGTLVVDGDEFKTTDPHKFTYEFTAEEIQEIYTEDDTIPVIVVLAPIFVECVDIPSYDESQAF